MRAMVLTAPKTLSSREFLLSPVKDGFTRVRVTHTGVCGTDLKVFNGEFRSPFPLVMGHEIVGETVSETGSVERVVIDPVLSCGYCYQCRAGQTQLCANGRVMGLDVDGGFSDYIDVPASNIHELPVEIDSAVAPLLQVLTTCVHSQRLMPIFPAEAAVVVGLGVAGQLQIQLAKARGCYPVIGISRSKYKRKVAESLGADYTCEGDDAGKTLILECTRGRGGDLVVDTTGALTSISLAINLARIGGRLLLFGITTATQGELPFYQLYEKELSLINSRAAKSEDFHTAIELVRSRKVNLDQLVTDRLQVSDLESAVRKLASDSNDRLKIILSHS